VAFLVNCEAPPPPTVEQRSTPPLTESGENDCSMQTDESAKRLTGCRP
jgi:hypothetical protein